jgi:acyl-coenzyme A synthetase/AMP-(fatty) acid ligase
MAQPRPGSLEHLAVLAPDVPVLVEAATGRELTRAQLDERASRLACGLATRDGVGPGTPVAHLLDAPVLELFVLTFALAKLGAVPVPLVPGRPASAVRATLDELGARVLVTGDEDLATTLGAVGLDSGLDALLDAGGDGSTAPMSGARIAPVTYAAAGSGRLVAHPDDRAGRAALSELLGDLAARARHRPSRRHLVAAPPWLPATLLHANIALLAGGTLVVLPDPDPSAWLDAIADEEPETTVVTPAMLAAVLALPEDERAGADTTALHAAVVAGDHLPVPHRRAAADLLGEDAVVPVYATADTGPVSALDGADVPDDDGSAGRPLRAVHVEVRDTSGGTAPRGAPGALRVRSPLGDGDTGDVGLREESGALRVLGRTGTPTWEDPAGRPAGVLRIRDVAHADPAVAAVAVDAAPGGQFAVRVRPCPGGTVDHDALTDRLRDALGPAVGAAVAAADDLPLDALGRVTSPPAR